MRPIIEECDYEAFVTPHVNDKNPMLRAMRHGPTGDEGATLPSLPNKFSAEVPRDQAETLRTACLKACRDEWKAICDKVLARLKEEKEKFDNPAYKGWDRDWDAQLASCLEVRCVF